MKEKSRENYLKELESLNRYCSCPSIAPLKERGERIRGLERECEFFKNNADLKNPSKEDQKFLEDYLDRRDELEKSTQVYLNLIAEFLKKSILVSRPLERGFIGFYCSNCGQQIEIGEEN